MKIKKKFRLFFFSLLRFIISIFITKKKIIFDKDLIILGRGKSLNQFKKNYKKFSYIKNVITVNFDKQDVRDGIYFLKNKNVIPIVNLDEPILPIIDIIKLNISECYFARLHDDMEKIKNKRNFKSLLYGKVNNFYGERMRSFFDEKTGAGYVSIVFFSQVIKVKNIYLFGFDFYQEGMHNVNMIENFKTKKIMNHHIRRGKKILKKFQKFMDKNQSTNFFLPKNSILKTDARNIKILGDR